MQSYHRQNKPTVLYIYIYLTNAETIALRSKVYSLFLSKINERTLRTNGYEHVAQSYRSKELNLLVYDGHSTPVEGPQKADAGRVHGLIPGR